MTRARSLRICIATSDIVGPIRNGGIGTGYYALAVALARAGHDVTVLYALGSYCERESIGYWQAHYASLGITFVPLPEADDLNLKGSHAVRVSYRVHLWLKERAFDAVHFHEWRGVGYYSLLAKRQGLSLQGTTVCVGAHSPSFWHKEGMREIPTTVEEFELDFMERESVALADVVWSPSRHMLQWMTAHGWPRPRKSFVLQYLMLDFLEPSAVAKLPVRSTATETARKARRGDASASSSPVKPAKTDELVFFGRLETRKGLDVFCDALDRLVMRGISPRRVVFLGKIATVDGIDSREYLERRATAWPHIECHIESGFDRDEAIAYLRSPGRVAVLPSRVDNLPLTVLECLGAGVPFVSSDVGGIPELVAKEDRPRVLSSLSGASLAKLLERAITRGLDPARPAVSLKRTLTLWLDWHQRLPRRTAARTKTPARQRQPKVSVCITHRNRAAFLAQALDSMRAQSYRRVEVVLVDDGSDRPEALQYLESLTPEFRKRGWKLIRQARRFPGAARNLAARKATGDYLLFMDDDNVARPDEVETLVRAATTSGADIFTCFLDVFQGAASPYDPEANVTRVFRWTFLGGCTAVGAVQNCFGDTNCLVKRKVFGAVGGFSEDYGVGFEDWEFLAKAALAGYRIEVVPEALVWYRQTGSGINSTTALDRNHWRALRPYLEKLPPEQRSLIALAKQRSISGASSASEPVRCDHVRTVVVFGAGEGGRLAVALAQTCGWSVAYIVDNNATLWGQSAHGATVKSPAALEARDFDLILVASYAGRQALSSQLERMGFSPGTNYAFFLDAFAVGNLQHRVMP